VTKMEQSIISNLMQNNFKFVHAQFATECM